MVHVIGTLVRLFGPMLLAPALVAAYYREWTDAVGFLIAAVSTSLLGQIMRVIGHRCLGPALRGPEYIERSTSRRGIAPCGIPGRLDRDDNRLCKRGLQS